MAGFTVNAADALRLQAEIAAKRAVLVPAVRSEVEKAGRRILALSRAGAPRGPHTTPLRFAESYSLKVRTTADGAEATVENRSPLGAIIVFGAARSGPHDSPGAALRAVQPAWEAAILELAARVI